MEIEPTEDEIQIMMESRAEDLALRDEEEHNLWCECLMCIPGA